MAYAINWLLQDRIIYVLNTGIGTANDVINTNREVVALLETCTSVVHLVIDGKTEKNDIGLGELVSIIRSNPASPNLGCLREREQDEPFLRQHGIADRQSRQQIVHHPARSD
jgi:hypothetical protein